MDADPELGISSESTAGSFHLSTANSLQRLRAAAPSVLPTKDQASSSLFIQSRDQTFQLGVTAFLRHLLIPASTLPLANIRHPHVRPWSTIWLRWMVLTYCFLSFVIFSVDLYTHTPLDGPPELNGSFNPSSSFVNISIAQRLSKLSPFHLGLRGLDPFLVRSGYTSDDPSISACLWTTDTQDIELLRSWVAQWRGPISLLMTTAAAPGSTGHKNVLKHLGDLKDLALPGLSVHLLHIHKEDQVSSNTYINLARLFAPTTTVMLVPGNLSDPPLISHDALAYQRARSGSVPLIIGIEGQSWSTFSALPSFSPAILQRNHPVWCTERFYPQNTRASDWRECLWQLWIENFGEFAKVDATSEEATKLLASSGVTHDRFSVKFRAQICDAAAKAMATLGLKYYRDGRKKLLWLKHACGQHSVERIFKTT